MFENYVNDINIFHYIQTMLILGTKIQVQNLKRHGIRRIGRENTNRAVIEKSRTLVAKWSNKNKSPADDSCFRSYSVNSFIPCPCRDDYNINKIDNHS